jgi:ADP-ribosylglycohydrolase
MPDPHPTLTPATADRARGVLMAMACGDALGAPYEFGPPLAPDHPVGMIGGGGADPARQPGEWTDDTSMAVVILQAAEAARAAGRPLTDHLNYVARGWADWARTAPDVGIQTKHVLAAAERSAPITAATATASATDLHNRTGRSGGNGSLMRTGPVALAYLHDEPGMVHAARTISAMTHHDPDAGDACVLWCAAIRHAVLTGELDARRGLDLLDPAARATWDARLDDAERRTPADFDRNGWVVEALQGAWSAIHSLPDDVAPSAHLRLALEAAVRGGRDADTVAAIAGALLGAYLGASAIPAEWVDVVHGWPGGMRVTELGDRGLALAQGA